MDANLKTYRGVDIKAFWDYGINSLEDLTYLEGNLLYESSFTSSSVLRTNSFFENHTQNNIEIEYLIPEEAKDGALLYSDTLSYSMTQAEYLFNSGSLFKVMKVDIDKENNCARIVATLIPKALWDPFDLEIDDSLSM